MQRAKPFALGKPPKPPKSVIVNRYPLLSLGRAESWLTTYPLLYGSQSQGAFGGSPPTDYPQWVACGQPPSQREGGSVWQIFTLEQLKSHSWNIAKETAHPSVGRSLSAGHHRLILPLYRLRLNAPPQDRLHRSNVTMLARAKPNIPHREPLRTIHTVAISLVFPQ